MQDDTGFGQKGCYDTPCTFTGIIHSVTIDVSGELIKDSEAGMRMAMARQ